MRLQAPSKVLAALPVDLDPGGDDIPQFDGPSLWSLKAWQRLGLEKLSLRMDSTRYGAVIRTVIATMVIAILVMILLRILARVSLPVRRIDLQMLRNMLYTLYLHGRHDACVVFVIRDNRVRFRVCKRIASIVDVRIVLSLPNQLTTSSVLDHVAFLNLDSTEAFANQDKRKVVLIDCGRDWDAALRLVVTIVAEGGQVPFDRRCDARMYGMHPDMNVQPGFSSHQAGS